MSITERSSPALPAKLPTQGKPQSGLGFAAEAYLAAARFRKHVMRIGFLLLVALPTACAILFYGLLASPRYVSEAKFIVRSVSMQQPTGLDMLFQTFGIAKTVDDGNVIKQYLVSRDALQAVIATGLDVKAIFQRPEADWWSSYPYFWRSDSEESLYDYYNNRVTVTEDTTKGILLLKVVTFRAEDSQLFAQTLLRLAEDMVNRMNARAQDDAMGAAQREVDQATEKVVAAQGALTEFRNREVMVDPSKSSFSLIETIGNLSTELSFSQAQLQQMAATSPNNPALPGLRSKIAALEERVAAERAKMAGGDASLATKIAAYEQLALRRDIADKSLESSMASLDVARQEARRQHIYVEEIVAANLSDEATEPKRLRSILTVFIFSFAVFAVIWIVSVGYGEHTQ